MSLTLANGNSVSIAAGLALQSDPAFLLSGQIVAVGPYADKRRHEERVLQTVGSVDWFSHESVDELRFSAEDGLLCSLALHVPQRQVRASGCAEAWSAVQPDIGLPRLDLIRNFRLPSTTNRWIAGDSSTLICFREDPVASRVDRVRCRVASDLDLLFEAGSLIGWMLGDADRYLSTDSGLSRKSPEDIRLARALGEYLSLINSDSMDELLDGSPALRSSLDRISASIPSGEGNRLGRSVVSDAISEVLVEWYS